MMLALWTVLLACSPKTSPLTIQGHKIQAEVVATTVDRNKGLMYRESMPTDHGMLFVYPDSKIRRFWMKNTPLPLSIAFLNDKGVIVKIADLQPHNTESVSSIYPAQYALEMNQGWFETNQISAGAKVDGIPEVKAEP